MCYSGKFILFALICAPDVDSDVINFAKGLYWLYETFSLIYFSGVLTRSISVSFVYYKQPDRVSINNWYALLAGKKFLLRKEWYSLQIKDYKLYKRYESFMVYSSTNLVSFQRWADKDDRPSFWCVVGWNKA